MKRNIKKYFYLTIAFIGFIGFGLVHESLGGQILSMLVSCGLFYAGAKGLESIGFKDDEKV